MVKLVLATVLGTWLLVSCGGGGGGAELLVTPPPGPTFTRAPTPTPTALPTPTATPTPRPAPTSTPVARSEEDARKLVWAHLSQCFPVALNELTALRITLAPDVGTGDAKDNWFVEAATGDAAQVYGKWRVDAASGMLIPHDVLAQDVEPYVKSGCDPAELPVQFRPTPTATPSPTDTPTPGPTPAPLITTAENAVATVWARLIQCFASLSIDDLEGRWDPGRTEWVVITKATAGSDFGVWRVRPGDGTIVPENRRAQALDETVNQGC